MVRKVIESSVLECRSKFQCGIDLKYCLLYRVRYFDNANAHIAN